MFLDAIGYKYRKLPLDAAAVERGKILSINNFLIKNNYILTNMYGFDVYGPLFTQQKVVLCFEIEKEALALQLDEMGLDFTIVQMDLVEIRFDQKIKGNLESMLA